jgi:hypothetical protein
VCLLVVLYYYPSVVPVSPWIIMGMQDSHLPGFALCTLSGALTLDSSILSCIVYGSNIRVPNAPESSIKTGESIGVDIYHDMSYESILVISTEKVRSQE